jgi:hypothetical protein
LRRSVFTLLSCDIPWGTDVYKAFDGTSTVTLSNQALIPVKPGKTYVLKGYANIPESDQVEMTVKFDIGRSKKFSINPSGSY